MAFEPKGAYFVEDFELGPLGFAGWTVVILFFFTGLVHFFYFLGQAEYAVFDGVDCGVEVDVVVVFVYWALLSFADFLAGVAVVVFVSGGSGMEPKVSYTASSLSSFNFPHSFRRSFCCIPSRCARSSLTNL